MARSRNIKPAFFKNEELCDLPVIDRLLFIGLWGLADREGRLEDRPKRVKMELFPCDNLDVDASLQTLADANFIKRYVIADQKIIQVLNFAKHQKPHGTEKDSELPDDDGFVTVYDRAKNGNVQGDGRKISVIAVAEEVISTTTEQLNNRYLTVSQPLEPVIYPLDNALIPDSLIPDSLIPDSLIPDSSVVESAVTQPVLCENGKSAALTADEPKIDRAVEIATLLRAKGIQATPAILRRSDFATALKQPDADWLAAAELAQGRKPGEQISVAYLRPMVEDYGRSPPARDSPRHSVPARDAGRQLAARSIFTPALLSEMSGDRHERTIN